ncbi:hypothetical protein C8J57DRAFT_1506841 [Mycena rebaudengoi]|nr:hypothetical protein C8J57DRAFT_1506841 [Mycena rebaudengoi]
MLPVALSALFLARLAIGQVTNATCSPTFGWASNSLGQSPCSVAAFLGSVCHTAFVVPALPNSTNLYAPPSVNEVNPCACSSVFYSLLQACAACQGATLLPWSKFDANCVMVYSQIFDENIPAGTAVPHWAYQDVNAQTDGTFNITLAQTQKELNAPESTPISKPTSASLPSGTSVAPSSKKSNAGAIAGGVVGGVVGAALITIAALWFIRRRRRGAAPSNLVAVPMGYHSTGDITPFTSAIPTPKLYDPADPSTFPNSPSSRMYNSGRVQSPTFTGNTVTDPHAQYSGAPEL